ncbi:DUF2797 domain-containing protein, partial [Dactylosporangium siamense]
PTLMLANPATARLDHIDIVGHTLGFAVTSTVRYCTGRYEFADTYNVRPLPCPHQAEATSGDQCAGCNAQDEFRFAHRAHQGHHIPAALQAYLAQPHWLYLATFGPGAIKVGTAAAPRKTSRLDEQGPIHATYLIEAPDGYNVRQLEETLSARLDIPQTVRATTKLQVLLHPDIDLTAHRSHVARAAAALTDLGYAPAPTPWSPPAAGHHLRNTQSGQHRAIYPHPLRTGEHGFHVGSCLGTRILVQLTPDPDAIRYILDLNKLKGMKISLGAFTSPATRTQTELF